MQDRDFTFWKPAGSKPIPVRSMTYQHVENAMKHLALRAERAEEELAVLDTIVVGPMHPHIARKFARLTDELSWALAWRDAFRDELARRETAHACARCETSRGGRPQFRYGGYQ